jgi:hypothetical protein
MLCVCFETKTYGRLFWGAHFPAMMWSYDTVTRTGAECAYLVSTGYPVDARAEKERFDGIPVGQAWALATFRIAGKERTLCQASAGQDLTSCRRIKHALEFQACADSEIRDNQMIDIDTDLWKKSIPPIFPFISRRHPDLSRISKHAILQHIYGVYGGRVFSVLHCPLYATFPNGLDRPVAEKRLWVTGPIFAVLAVVVAARANDSGFLGIDYVFAFLVGQAIDVRPRSATTIRNGTAE